MSRVILRTRDGYVKDTYERLRLPMPVGADDHGYMCAERGWDKAAARPTFAVMWCSEIGEATEFPTAAAAWAVFDKSGVGRREDYLTEELT